MSSYKLVIMDQVSTGIYIFQVEAKIYNSTKEAEKYISEEAFDSDGRHFKLDSVLFQTLKLSDAESLNIHVF